jgi:hypothetical protein
MGTSLKCADKFTPVSRRSQLLCAVSLRPKHKLSFTHLRRSGYSLACNESQFAKAKDGENRSKDLAEVAMKTTMFLFCLMLTASLCAAQTSAASEGAQDKKATKASQKESRWQGHIVRMNKDGSSLTVRGGSTTKDSFEREIFYSSSTEWTKAGKPAQQDEFKDGSFVIVLGRPDDKGTFQATRIDLRLPR